MFDSEDLLLQKDWQVKFVITKQKLILTLPKDEVTCAFDGFKDSDGPLGLVCNCPKHTVR